MVSQGLTIVFALGASICGALWDQPVSAQPQPVPAVACAAPADDAVRGDAKLSFHRFLLHRSQTASGTLRGLP